VGAGVAAIIAWSIQQRMGIAPEPSVEAPGATVRERNAPPAERASANLPALFRADDYPKAALSRDEQGTVAFELAINRHGRVESCFITTSSGSNALDRATCTILTRRARFTPARGADGQAIADTTSGRIRWQLPEE